MRVYIVDAHKGEDFLFITTKLLSEEVFKVMERMSETMEDPIEKIVMTVIELESKTQLDKLFKDHEGLMFYSQEEEDVIYQYLSQVDEPTRPSFLRYHI